MTVFVNLQLLTTFSFCFCVAMDAAIHEPATEADIPTEKRKGESNCTVREGYGTVSVSVFVFLPGTLPESFAAIRALANG